ncbi:MAG: hypothetical protein HY811_01105 [Planctomycetes bacterium]|nr:hypothetical protein [Planctomycetota bacterium]
MDTTALGIMAGIGGVFVFVIIQLFRQRTWNIINTVLVFLAYFSIPAGVDLLMAAFWGDEKKLPELWRQYIVVASIVVIGVSIQFVIQTLKSAWTKLPASEEDIQTGN